MYSFILLSILILLSYIYFFYKQQNVLLKIAKPNEIDLLHTSKTQQITSWALSNLNVQKLNNSSNKKIKIAILDSGIDKNHEDLQDTVIKEYNAINPQEPVTDTLGHGTTIAGILAAQNNTIGISGISSSCVEIYSVKVLNDNGKGKIDNLIRGINWSIDNNVDILNISFGMSSNNVDLENVIKKALQAGIIVVASAGNNYGGNVEYPANYKDVISVTAVDHTYKIASFTAKKGKIDFSAPGVDILTTSILNNYTIEHGTSLATAHVTGIISLILANHEKFNLSTNKKNLPKEIYTILEQHSVNIGKKTHYGNGFIKI
ncbi:S8 family peptidase [Bacillus mycoides]|uniref:Peptidase S8/S53 domain-containing protein n=1 Tax=Bacillus cereus VD021 TaxID=1053224 RepID=R8GWR8_BACCE|nr:S8 family peptidase [Bacillus cereus]EOO65013.1 hypothetical protein IIC_06196 [Bacillus cereus VD021]